MKIKIITANNDKIMRQTPLARKHFQTTVAAASASVDVQQSKAEKG